MVTIDWKKLRTEWEASDISLKGLAEKYGIKATTVRSRKNREKWQRNATQSVATKRPVAEEVKRVMENPDLTDKQKLFCLYYSRSFNATRSYQKAYDVSYVSACASGPRLMGNKKIKAEIARLKEQRYSRALLSPEDVFQKFMDIAFADVTDYVEFGQEEVQVIGRLGGIEKTDEKTGEKVPVTETVNVVKFKESADVDGTIIGEVKQGRGGASIRLADRMRALSWLADHMHFATEEQRARVDKIKTETEFTKEKTKLIKGEERDLTLLKELLRVDE